MKTVKNATAQETPVTNDQNVATEQEQAPAIIVPAIEPEPTSDELTALYAKYADAEEAAEKLPKGSPERRKANLEIFKIDGQITAEIAKIKKDQQNAVLAEKRNARVKLADDFGTAIFAGLRAVGVDISAETEAAVLADANVAGSREIVVNELLARHNGSTPSRSVATGTTAGTGEVRGAVQSKIKELLLAELAGGATVTMAVKNVIASGQSRGTTGAVRTAMKQAGELVAYGENPE